MRTVWIQRGNGGGIAGVWEYPPTLPERSAAYAAHLNVPCDAEFEKFIELNAHLAEYDVSPLPGTEDLQFLSLLVGEKGDEISLERGLSALLNYFGKDVVCDTPDHLLASYLMGCLANFEKVVKERDKWFAPIETEPADE